MSYSIDFHFGDLPADYNDALQHADAVLRQFSCSYMTPCQPLDFDEESGIDFDYPAVRAASVEEGAILGKDWIGRAHFYSALTTYDLVLYGWKTEEAGAGLVLSLNHSAWQKNKIVLAPYFARLLCSIAERISSPFGLSRVNADYFALKSTDLDQAVEWLAEGSPEPELLWARNDRVPFEQLKRITEGRRKLLLFPQYSAAY